MKNKNSQEIGKNQKFLNKIGTTNVFKFHMYWKKIRISSNKFENFELKTNNKNFHLKKLKILNKKSEHAGQ